MHFEVLHVAPRCPMFESSNRVAANAQSLCRRWLGRSTACVEPVGPSRRIFAALSLPHGGQMNASAGELTISSWGQPALAQRPETRWEKTVDQGVKQSAITT